MAEGPRPPETDYLRRVPIFNGLEDGTLASLATALHRRTYPAGAIVFHQGDPGHALYLIASGKARVFMTSERGKEMTVDILSRGEVFGEMALLSDYPRSASVMTLTTTQVLTLHRDDFHRFLRAFPEIAINILAILTERLRATTAYAADLVFNDLHGRLAQMLLVLADRHGVPRAEGIEIDLPLTQVQLAALLGTTRESVSRTMAAYRDYGFVAVRGSRITVLRPEDLRETAAHRTLTVAV
jgi:CRP-like cAMP-binding protein